jgi:hypothetical protein
MNTTLAANGNNRTASLAACQTGGKFVFNATGRAGCLAGGLGGMSAMNCYTARPTPSMTRNPLPNIACSRCAQWNAETSTLRITAEQRVDAGSVITFKFSREDVEIFPPNFGLAADSPTVQVVHSNDVRKVPEREKYRTTCSIKRVPSHEQTHPGCLKGSDATTFSSPTDSRASVRANAGTSRRSAVFGVQLASFDPQVTGLVPTQEPVSPVMHLRIEPGVVWDKPLKVAVPMSGAPLVSIYSAYTHADMFVVCGYLC